MFKFQLRSSIPVEKSVRELVESGIQAAIESANPGLAVRKFLQYREDHIILRGAMESVAIPHGIRLVSLGKAAIPMAGAAYKELDEKIRSGLVIGKVLDNNLDLPPAIRILQGGHPIPDERSLVAGEALRQYLQEVDSNLPVLFLLSGGGSALVACPPTEISIRNLALLNQVMVKSHLSIDEINTIRKHVDLCKGGGLLRWVHDKPTISLILSDIVSSRLDMVASGPTLPDPSSFRDALAILHYHQMEESIPLPVLQYLKEGDTGKHPETLKPQDIDSTKQIALEIGSLSLAKAAVSSAARALGWQVNLVEEPLIGQVESVSERLVDDIRQQQGLRHTILIYGGETTVKPTGTGLGGRNTHLAFLLSRQIQAFENVVVVTLATDGEDGNCPAAGAVVDSKTYTKSVQKGMNFSYYGYNFDSYSFFEKLNDLVVTGPTETNVNDVVLVIFT